jgi:hypothetical protein
MWRLLLRRARASTEEQPLYPRLGIVLRALYLGRRVLGHARRMDFSITTGCAGWVFWRIGLVGLWWRRFTPRLPRPEGPEKWEARASAVAVISER